MEDGRVPSKSADVTLPRNRCKVRADEGLAKPIPHRRYGQSIRCLSERLPCLVEAATVEESAGG